MHFVLYYYMGMAGPSLLIESTDYMIEQAKRHQQIYTPQEWYDLVCNACHTSPFSVVEMTSNNFVAIKEFKKNVNRK